MVVGNGAAPGPARRDRRAYRFAHSFERVGSVCVQNAASGMKVRPFRVSKKLRGARHLAWRRLDGLGSPVRLRRTKVDAVRFEHTIHHGFRNIEVHHARATRPTDSCCTSKKLGKTIERRNRATPLGHRTGNPGLVEVLVCASAIGICDWRAPARGDEQYAVALAVLYGDSGQNICNAGPVGSHTNAELACQPCVGPGHVRRAGFVPWRHHLEARKETHVGAVDDAEHDLDTLGCQHSG